MTTPETAVEDEDGFTELRDAQTPRLDAVGAAANGTAWFYAKQAADTSGGLFEADYVRELIEKADNDTEQAEHPAAPVLDPRETVTVSGSPAALAKMIHEAAQRATVNLSLSGNTVLGEKEMAGLTESVGARLSAAVYDRILKAKYNTADRKRMAGTGAALPDGSYPIADRADLTAAVRAVGRGENTSHDTIRRHVISRAKSLGAASEIPETWNADGSLAKTAATTPAPPTGEVAKDMDTDESAGMPMDETETPLEAGTVLACPEEEAPGDPRDPGSPAWEAIDAATARYWTWVAARLRSALGVMADREMLEAASADPEDAEAAMDLDDAACAVDYAISVLAPFAIDEQAEADEGCMAVGKALAAVDAGDLEAIEAYGAVRKSGRALSSANEQALRSALKSIQQILASLPQAPDATPAAAAAPMQKEAPDAMTETDTAREELNSQHPLGTDKTPPADTPAAIDQPGVVAKQTETAAADTAPAPAANPGAPAMRAPDAPAAVDLAKAEQPAAPAPEGEQVAKSAAQPVPAEHPAPAPAAAQEIAKADPAAPQPAAEQAPATEPVAKAGKAPQVAIYDAQGNLVGTVDPGEITMLAPAKAPEAAAEPAAAEGAEPEQPAADAPAPAPATPPTDLAPAPSAAAGTPADAVDDGVAKTAAQAAAPTPDTSQELLKGIAQEALKAVLTDRDAQHASVVKALEERNQALEERNSTLEKTAADLDERLSFLENKPAIGNVFANGQLPPRQQLRGQDTGAPSLAGTAGDLRKALSEEVSATGKQQISDRLRELAIEEYAQMRQRGAAI